MSSNAPIIFIRLYFYEVENHRGGSGAVNHDDRIVGIVEALFLTVKARSNLEISETVVRHAVVIYPNLASPPFDWSLSAPLNGGANA